MAGRMSGASLGGRNARPFHRWARAYAEGRAQYPSAVNPHPAATVANAVWQNGYDNRADPTYKYETAVT